MNPTYVIISYALSFVTIVGYALWLWRRQRALEEDLAAVEAEVETYERRRR